MSVNIVEVRRALQDQQVVPCFQPLVELQTRQLIGFELLARWQHPQLGMILPENFISLAEENGLLGQLTKQVLRKAFSSVPMMPEPPWLAVNVSPIQLRDASLPEQIREAARESQFPLDRLTVEINEQALVVDLKSTQKNVYALKEMGCRLALEDFGTGFSSLVHLQALPFDVLKIDRNFIAGMTRDRESCKTVAAIVGLGRALGLITIAEGVETEQQAEMLLQLGCELGQGWLYGWPVPPEEVRGVVASYSQAVSSKAVTQDKIESKPVAVDRGRGSHPAAAGSSLQRS
jgi:EAL domain-containing protein (putative c-di-GMP-specific phosphodiesterase class I)